MKRLTTKEFIEKSNKTHNNKYDYSLVNYTKNFVNVEIICPSHGLFLQQPSNHFQGKGCTACARDITVASRKGTNKKFIKLSTKIHNNKFDYSKSKYTGYHSKIEIICPDHNSFWQSAGSHMRGIGCPTCAKRGYSKIAIKWLNSINPNIQHAENGGEYCIPDTLYRVDGYCSETNTAYEFHGDRFHGNPKLYGYYDTCHPFDKDIIAGELYQKTIDREDEIKSLGYNLVVMWESSYLEN